MPPGASAGAGPGGSSVGGSGVFGITYGRLQSYISNAVRRAPLLRNDQIYGMDTDEVFAYSTKKVVWIRDRSVGVCYYGLIVAIILWVIGGQILWHNEHFLMKDVDGLARMWYTHPTMYNCDATRAGCKANFTNIRNLPYCDQSLSSSYPMKAHCEYEDKLSLVPQGVTDNKLFLTTAMEMVTERRTCYPTEANNFTCDNTYTPDNGTNCMHPHILCRDRGNETNQYFYIADVKNYKIRFTSSYARDDIRGTSLMHPAFVGICPSQLRLDNLTRTWSSRKMSLEQNACGGTLQIEKLPCEYGVDCAKMRKFDLLEDTGVSVVSRGIQSRIRDLGERGVSWKSTIVDEAKFVAQAATGGAGAASIAGVGAAAAAASGGNFGASKRRRTQAFLRKSASTGTRLARESPSTATEHPEPLATEYSDNWGDVFTVGRLLQLAGADLDLDYNMDGWTTRQGGTVLEVRAVYNNLYPVLSTFGYKPVKYHYEVNELMLPYVSRTQMSEVQPSDYPNTRKYEIRYGILIHFKVAGAFGFFNMVYLLLMLTTAFALTATATTVTDLFFLYLSDQSDNFFHLKYEVTPDFSDMWRCEKCGFFNLDTSKTCQGVPKFMCPKTTPVCGAPRPAPELGAKAPEA